MPDEPVAEPQERELVVRVLRPLRVSLPATTADELLRTQATNHPELLAALSEQHGLVLDDGRGITSIREA